MGGADGDVDGQWRARREVWRMEQKEEEGTLPEIYRCREPKVGLTAKYLLPMANCKIHKKKVRLTAKSEPFFCRRGNDLCHKLKSNFEAVN
jgi:hypothetical protein